MNILIIDNDKKSLDKIQDILSPTSIEYNITSTDTIKEAVQSLDMKEIDIIIVDFVIKNISINNVKELLKHIQSIKTIPIIFVIENLSIDFSQYGLELGSVDYILKPIDPQLLISRLSLYETIMKQNRLLNKTNQLLQKELLKDQDKFKLQEHMLIQQSKTSSMGEMIGAIAHQWRQPLNIIATSIINLETKAELEILDLKEIQRINTKINDTLHYLSKTIDDFRNFFLISHEKQEVNLVDTIESTIDMVQAQFLSYNISICFEYTKTDSFLYMAYNNEIRQVIINILTNSKDAIQLQGEKFKGEIHIELKKEKNFFLIRICDNAGGIEEKIIKKIFHPYFSTKFEGQGTGTALYMSKTIIEQFHNGKLKAYNDSDGACFEIILYLDL